MPETNAPEADPAAETTPLTLPAAAGPPPALAKLAEQARDYARRAQARNTQRAYAADWRHYGAWTRRQGVDALPPRPETIGLYIAACAAGASNRPKDAVRTIERRLSALAWNFTQRGFALDRADRHIATVLAGVRRAHARPPAQKEAILPEDLRAMLATLDLGALRGLRDRAILLLGFAGGLRRSEIVGLDCGADETQDGSGWIEILEKGIVATLRGKTGWREVEIGPGAFEPTCPVRALEAWLRFARIAHGPLFRRVTGDGKKVGADRLADIHVARLVKKCALAAGVRGDLSEGDRKAKFSAIRCAPASPPPPRSTNAMCKSSSATPRPK
jgi:integrase